METVHVFVRGDGIQHGIGVKVFGQRQLHEDAVHLRIGVEFGDFGKQRFLSGVGGQFVFEAGKTRFFGLDAFVAHIDFAGRVIADEDDGKAGLVELVEIDHVHRRAEFQIIVAPDHQGRGIATRATELAMEYGFSVLNLYKIYLIVDVENASARHVYEKLGFQPEGVLRHEFFINGQYRDVTRMCLFQHDYLQRGR